MIKLAEDLNEKYAPEPEFVEVQNLPESQQEKFYYTFSNELKGLISDLNYDKSELSHRVPNKALDKYFDHLIKSITSIVMELSKVSPYAAARKFVDFGYKNAGMIDRLDKVLKQHLSQTNPEWFSGSQEGDRLKFWNVTSLTNLLDKIDEIDVQLKEHYSGTPTQG